MSAVPMPLRERRYLQPGQLAVSVTPAAITTILGSCVAVCLWEPQRGIGGMNHFMLPMAAGNGAASSPRFGPAAMEQLLAQLRDAGARVPLLRARVYGGACMFEMPAAAQLGRKNADVAIEFLQRRGIEIVEIDVGGTRGRKLIFNTDEGTTCLTLI
ncbi:MAG TPA: chemotaxis protein CheD [Thermoanaerobaculia bacterium]|nr:chemotaxis protein CheD [Thermoanaerobaculia bacterium]